VINAYAVDTEVSTAFKLQCLVPMSDRPCAEQATEFVEPQRGPTLTRRDNAFCNASERSEGRSSLKSLPTQIQIELSSRCNLRCIMCLHHDSDFGEFMSDDLYGIVKEELFPTAREIGFCGVGEALLHPRWDSILKDVSENDIRPLLITNGTLLNEELLRRLVDAGFHTNFSIDAVQPRTYSFIRGASLPSVVSWVQKMHDYRLSSRNRKAQISILFTPMLINLHELPELVKMASKWDVQHVGVHHFMDYGGTEQWAPENLPSFAQRMYAEAARNAEKYDVTLVVAGRILYRRRALPFAGVDTDADIWQPPALQPQYHGCALPFSAATVALDGDVRTCCWNSPPMGNLFYQKFRDIWNGERWRTLRQRLVDRDPPEYCRSCHMLSYATDPAHDTGHSEVGRKPC